VRRRGFSLALLLVDGWDVEGFPGGKEIVRRVPVHGFKEMDDDGPEPPRDLKGDAIEAPELGDGLAAHLGERVPHHDPAFLPPGPRLLHARHHDRLLGHHRPRDAQAQVPLDENDAVLLQPVEKAQKNLHWHHGTHVRHAQQLPQRRLKEEPAFFHEGSVVVVDEQLQLSAREFGQA